jgi:putative transcriptional regulator
LRQIFDENNHNMTDKKVINRIKVVLAENDRTNRWLAEAIGKNEATVSRWCSNKAQPSIDVFRQIAEALDVDVRELLHTTKK